MTAGFRYFFGVDMEITIRKIQRGDAEVVTDGSEKIFVAVTVAVYRLRFGAFVEFVLLNLLSFGSERK